MVFNYGNPFVMPSIELQYSHLARCPSLTILIYDLCTRETEWSEINIFDISTIHQCIKSLMTEMRTLNSELPKHIYLLYSLMGILCKVDYRVCNLTQLILHKE